MATVRATTKQGERTVQKVYDFIVEYMITNLYAPSVREIGDGVGLASTSSVYRCLEVLSDRGLIKNKENTPRAIKLVGYHLEKDKESIIGDQRRD